MGVLTKERGTVIVVALLLAGIGSAALYFSRTSSGCTKPEGGFLVLVTGRGFNGSLDHNSSWPTITVGRGSSVSIVVCNNDDVAHGFQIDRYYAGSLVSMAPKTSISVTFVADQAGDFRIFCQIPCPIHFGMLNGKLTVSP